MDSPRWLNEEEARTWRAYREMSTKVDAALHRSLSDASGLSLADYGVLAHLSESPQGRLRAYELGAALQWEKSRLSHHLKRMEKRGLVERRTCESDGRGLWVVLTPRGRQAIVDAAPRHVEDVRRFLIDLLTPAQTAALAEIAEKVVANLPPVDDLCDS